MLKADLKVLGGKQHGKLIALLTPKFLIGREDDCQLRPGSELVSRHHCVFSVDDFSVRLRDLGSTNGTLVNGQKIRGEVVLNAGDRVRIGKLEFEIVVRPGVRQAASAPVAVGGQSPPLESPTPPPPAANQPPIDADTGQLSSSETSFEIPTAPNVLNDTSASAAPESGDTTVFYQPQPDAAPPAQEQVQPPVAPDPMPAPPAALDPAQAAPPAAVDPAQAAPAGVPPAPQAPAPPVPPNYPGGVQPDPMQPPGQMPQYPPGQMPQYPPGAYPPQMPMQYPHQQYGYPYPQQMPPQYLQPGMPYQQPMMPPPQAPAIDDGLDDMDSEGTVPAPPIKLPSPEETGASPEKPVVGSEGTVKREAGSEAEVKPYEKAADLIRQMVQRRPGGGG